MALVGGKIQIRTIYHLPSIKKSNIVISLVYHTKLHTSQTKQPNNITGFKLVYHTKLHTSQTIWQAAAISPHACLP